MYCMSMCIGVYVYSRYGYMVVLALFSFVLYGPIRCSIVDDLSMALVLLLAGNENDSHLALAL